MQISSQSYNISADLARKGVAMKKRGKCIESQ